MILPNIDSNVNNMNLQDTKLICKTVADDMRFMKQIVHEIPGFSNKSKNIIVNEWTPEVN